MAEFIIKFKQQKFYQVVFPLSILAWNFFASLIQH